MAVTERDRPRLPGMSQTSVIVVGAAIVRWRCRAVCPPVGPGPSGREVGVPGGKVEAGESDAEAVVRECREELGVEVTVGAR